VLHGKHFVELRVILKLANFEFATYLSIVFFHSNFLGGDHVTLESGTGVVHTAPGHGVEDFKICAENDIPSFVPVNDYGKFTAEAGER
jgi:isoleucyl-tRNA synthetase